MAKNRTVQLTGKKHGLGIEIDNLSGKPLTDQQAQIVVAQYLGEVLDAFAASVSELTRAIQRKDFP